jgi:hypothetical protein
MTCKTNTQLEIELWALSRYDVSNVAADNGTSASVAVQRWLSAHFAEQLVIEVHFVVGTDCCRAAGRTSALSLHRPGAAAQRLV